MQEQIEDCTNFLFFRDKWKLHLYAYVKFVQLGAETHLHTMHDSKRAIETPAVSSLSSHTSAFVGTERYRVEYVCSDFQQLICRIPTHIWKRVSAEELFATTLSGIS